jgi:hypothetical protein
MMMVGHTLVNAKRLSYSLGVEHERY